jgi:hypothetical protein
MCDWDGDSTLRGERRLLRTRLDALTRFSYDAVKRSATTGLLLVNVDRKRIAWMLGRLGVRVITRS